MREGVLRVARLAASLAALGAGAMSLALSMSARAAEPAPRAHEGTVEPATAPPAPAPTSPAPSAPGATSGPAAAALVSGTSTCPLPSAVWSELETLIPRERLNARLRAIGGPAPRVEIVDLGVPYRVIAAGRVREYRDEARDCAYRARVAAVFVVLVIDPAVFLTEPPPPPRPPPAPPPPPVADEAPVPGLRLEAGLGAAVGLGSGGALGESGLAARAVAGRGRLAFVAGATATLPRDVTVGGLALRQWRLPADAGVRARFRTRALETYGELGVGVALLTERALDLASPASRTAVELGLRGALGARTAGRTAPFVALAAELVPDPPDIFALPRGVVGHTPTFWLGLTAGLSLGLR